MVQQYLSDKDKYSHGGLKNKSVFKVSLADLQKHFYDNLFYFDEYYYSEDYDMMLDQEYEEQAIGFLRSIGAIVPLEVFFSVESDYIIYVRKVPPGITPV